MLVKLIRVFYLQNKKEDNSKQKMFNIYFSHNFTFFGIAKIMIRDAPDIRSAG